MGIKEQLTEALSAMQEQTKGLATWVADSKRTGSGDYEHWGPKDLLAHAAEWTQRRIAQLKDPDYVEPVQGLDQLERVNRELFERHRDTSWDDVIQMLHSGVETLAGEVAGRSETELVAEDGRSGDGHPVWRGIAFYGIVHSLTHIAQALVRSGNSDTAVRLQTAMTPPLLAIDGSEAWTATIEYNLGRVFALAGNREEAAKQVKLAIAKSPDLAERAANDPDFESIRGDIE